MQVSNDQENQHVANHRPPSERQEQERGERRERHAKFTRVKDLARGRIAKLVGMRAEVHKDVEREFDSDEGASEARAGAPDRPRPVPQRSELLGAPEA